MELPITSVLAALFAAGLVALSFPVSLRRIKVQADLGHADDDVLYRRIRTQGNFVEYAPMGLIVVGLMELGGAGTAMVWAVAGALALGRLFHATGMLIRMVPIRVAGMILTYSALLVGAAVLLRRALG